MAHTGNSETLKKQRRKGRLCAAFSAVALLSGCAAMTGGGVKPEPDDAAPVLTPSGDAVPAALRAFNTTAIRVPRERESEDLYSRAWKNMWQHQKDRMKNRADAEKLRAFLKMFDRFRGEPLPEMATDVSQQVQRDLTYTSDMKQYGVEDYWAAPAETASSKRGDCEDYAILQYAVLRHLGVPDNRLFLAAVGSHNYTADHAVLLFNVAAAGAPQAFAVLNDFGPVVPSRRYARWQGANEDWTLPYKFYSAVNEDGLWRVPQKSAAPQSPARPF